MASETQVLPEPPLSFKSFIASLPVVPIQELSTNERVCNICTSPYRESTVGFTAINVSSENPVRLACGHIFGKHCIATWLAKGTTCPLCRRQFFEQYTPQGSMRRSWHDHMPDPTDRVRNTVFPLDAARGTTVRRLVGRRPMPRLPDETTRLRPRVWIRRPAATRMLLAARAQIRNDSTAIEPSATGQEAEREVPRPRRRISSLFRGSQVGPGVAETQTAAVPRQREAWSTERQGPVHGAERMEAAPEQETIEPRPVERSQYEQESGPPHGIAGARSTSRAAALVRRPRTFGDFASMRASPNVATVAAQSNQIVPVATPRTRTSVALIRQSRRVTTDSESRNVSTRASSRIMRRAAQGSSSGPATNPRIVGRPLTRSMSRGSDLEPGLQE
jgi:hypothetical protein